MGLSLVVAFVVALCSALKILCDYRRLKHIPGPAWAALTNAPRVRYVLTGKAHEIHAQLHVKYGPVVRLGPNMVSVDDPHQILTIYPTKAGFLKTSFYDVLSMYSIANGVLPSVFTTRDEELHRKLRSPVSPMFSVSSVSKLEPLLDEVLGLLMAQLDIRFASTGHPCDMNFWLKALAFDAMGMMTFSRRYGFLEVGEDVGNMEENIWDFMVKSAPMTQAPWLDRLMNKNQLSARIKAPASLHIVKFVQEKIHERREELKSMEFNRVAESHQDMLSRYITITEERYSSVPDWAPTTWTISNVVAGSDTTATVLSALWYYLISNQICLHRLSCEIKAATKSELPAWMEIKGLEYLDACVWEAVRLHPPFTLPLEREVPKSGCHVRGVFLPSGTRVGLNPYVTNRHQETFGKDANAWRPERWIEGKTVDQKRKLKEYIMTFGAGRRICMGRHLAIFEVKKTVAMMLQNYQFELSLQTAWKVKSSWFFRNEGLFAKISKTQ